MTFILDIIDSGGDPDYLSYHNPENRDSYLHGLGLNPDNYRPSSYSSSSVSGDKSPGFFDQILDDFFSYDPSVEQTVPSYTPEPFPDLPESDPESEENDSSYEYGDGGARIGYLIDDYGMEQLEYLGYDEEDVASMSEEDLAEALEDAGIDPDMYEL